jgi:hypothetical protein
MTSGAVLIKERMGGRKLAGAYKALQIFSFHRYMQPKGAHRDGRDNETKRAHNPEPFTHG